jgi:hypothetical protein
MPIGTADRVRRRNVDRPSRVLPLSTLLAAGILLLVCGQFGDARCRNLLGANDPLKAALKPKRKGTP